jgi:hypothetical protein
MNDLSKYYAVRDQIQTMDLLQRHGESWVKEEILLMLNIKPA